METQSAPTVVSFGDDVLERMVLAVELVRERLYRATEALHSAGIRYAVAGGNAVAAWVARVDPKAVRNTVDVDILIDRKDFERAKTALESVGFIYTNLLDVDMFLDGPDGSPRDAVHFLYAGEKVRQEYTEAAPDLTAVVSHERFDVVGFDELVRMKLTSFRRKDQVHLQDMIEIGLIDSSTKSDLSPELADRLQQLLDDPHG